MAIYEQLDKAYPDAGPELHFETPFELLVAVVLSAQCTDRRVNLATPALFQAYPTSKEMALASPEDIEPFIRSCGLYRNKARNLVALSKVLQAEHEGQVPLSRSVLRRLPGVGEKTAGVVAMHLGGDLAFPVDTHVKRLSERLGLSDKPTPEKVEADLKGLLDASLWYRGHHLLIFHGRRCCTARSPKCDTCPIQALCPSSKSMKNS